MVNSPQPSVRSPAAGCKAAIPVSRSLLPTFNRLAPYLREIDRARYYTNHGQMHDRLQARLARHFDIDTSNIALASSGTSALIGLILSVAGYAEPTRPLCVCPSYTFVATAAAARACGYTPFLVDIDEATWALNPARLEHLPEIHQVALVIVVAPYGRMPDITAWQDFQEHTGIPGIIDAAASFDTMNAAAICRGQIAAAVSLHATKTLSTAEGGLILCGDAAIVERTGRALNFGFHNNRESTGPSINGKISEYHAAIGLADLDGWDEKRAGFIAAARAYESHAARHGLQSRIIADRDHANPYALFAATDAREAAIVTAALEHAHIGHRYWYGRGLHRQPEYRACPSEDLFITDRVADRLIGLPLAADLQGTQIERVIDTLADTLR